MTLNGITRGSPGTRQDPFPISPRRRALFWSLALGLGFLRIWAHRYDVNPDGLEYVEIAWASVHMGLRAFINGYWSPLYPFVLSLMFRIVHPALDFESTAVQLVNLLIYLFNLLCFELFLRELIRLRSAQQQPTSLPSDRTPLRSETLATVGYLFFLWTTYVWLSPTLVTPDLCTAAFAYLAMALLLRIRAGRGTWAIYALLGATIGLAYLAKAAMFPVAFFFLAAAFLTAPTKSARENAGLSRSATALRTAFAAIVFLLVAAPLVLALSSEEHHLSFGESGRDNYAWYVNRSSLVYWQGGPAGMGTPLHPARQLLVDPPLFEFATPIPGSYPPGYEPSYWFEGVRPHLEFYSQARALLRGLNFYFQMVSRTGVLYIVFLALSLALRNGGRWIGGVRYGWQLWLPAYAALGLYALVHVEPRFVGEFALMLLLGLFACVQLPKSHTGEQGRSWPACLPLVLILAPALAIGISAGFDLAALHSHPGLEDFQLARSLNDMGVRNSQAVAAIGAGPSFYWAHLAGVRVVADVPSAVSYWGGAPAFQAAAFAKLKEVGAKAVVTKVGKGMQEPDVASGWKRVSDTPYFVRAL